jgi:hypothetical protein
MRAINPLLAPTLVEKRNSFANRLVRIESTRARSIRLRTSCWRRPIILKRLERLDCQKGKMSAAFILEEGVIYFTALTSTVKTNLMNQARVPMKSVHSRGAVPVRLTPEENAALVERVKAELRSPNASTYLGDPLTAGPVRYDSRLGIPLGIPKASGPILDHTPAPAERLPLSKIDHPPSTPSEGSTPDPSHTSEDFTRLLPREASASKPSFTTSYAMMRMRPGETRTQKIDLPRVTLNVTVSVS